MPSKKEFVARMMQEKANRKKARLEIERETQSALAGRRVDNHWRWYRRERT